MAEKNIFEVATKCKYRFPYKGMISVEDLWTLNMKALDEVFKALNAELKITNEESLLSEKSPADEEVENKIAIVKHIYNCKVQEQNERLLANEKRKRDQKIMSIIARKEDAELENMSKEDLLKMLGE
jgi:hypothetical protein